MQNIMFIKKPPYLAISLWLDAATKFSLDKLYFRIPVHRWFSNIWSKAVLFGNRMTFRHNIDYLFDSFIVFFVITVVLQLDINILSKISGRGIAKGNSV